MTRPQSRLPDHLRAITMYEGRDISVLLQELETQRDPRLFKEVVLGITQVYFDGLVDGNDVDAWSEQAEALNAVLRGTRETVSAFYDGAKQIPYEQVQAGILIHRSTLVRYGPDATCKKRHLSGREVNLKRYATNVAVTLDGRNIDTVVAIASGGFEPAALVADYLGVDTIVPVRYSRLAKGDTEVRGPQSAPEEYFTQNITGRNVLVVDDMVKDGRTLAEVKQWVKGFRPREMFVNSALAVRMSLENIGLYAMDGHGHVYQEMIGE